jgi:hypothetical protein
MARALIYPSGMTQLYDTITPAPYWQTDTLNFESPCDVSNRENTVIWNMNIPWSVNPAGLFSSQYEGYGDYGSVTYLGTKEYLGYQEPTGQTDTSRVYYYNSFDEEIVVTPQAQKAIAIIHYTNQDIDNVYGEKFSTIPYDPQNPTTIYAALMGLPFERNNDRGLYKSTDEGATWEQVLFLSDEVGITDLKINYDNPNIIYAAGWHRIRNNQESVISGELSRVYKSVDGGANWETLTNGLPDGNLCRIGLEMSVNDPNVVWALVVGTNFEAQGIYKTEDGGASWVNLLPDPQLLAGTLGGFGWYFGKIRVNPFNESEISILGVDLHTSYDNGESWQMTTPPWWMYEVHADKHDMVYLDGETVVLATDGGLYRTDDHFTTWYDIDNIPNTQFYRIALNPFQTGFYTGGAQDNGTTTGNIGTLNEWTRDFGGDGFQAVFDPVVPERRYMETQNGNHYVDDFGNVFNISETLI